MKYQLLIIWLLVGLAIGASASAHVLATDGTIGAVLHVDPNDEPIAQAPASFFFEFKDTTGKFKPQDCTCTVVIARHDQQVYQGPLWQTSDQPSLTNAVFSYTFTEADAYTVQVHGQPQVSGEFNPFTLNYVVRVDKAVAIVSPVPSGTRGLISGWVGVHVVHLWGAIFLAIVLVGMIIYERVHGVKEEKPT